MTTTTAHLTPAELDALLEVAKAATPGEWLRSSLAVAYIVSEKSYPVIAAFAEYDVDGSIHKEFENGVANQEFVIRANPATITRLVLMVRELQTQHAQLEQSLRPLWAITAPSGMREPSSMAELIDDLKQMPLGRVEHFRARAVGAILTHQPKYASTVVDDVIGALARIIESLPLVEMEEE